jgi:hypothetical protein
MKNTSSAKRALWKGGNNWFNECFKVSLLEYANTTDPFESVSTGNVVTASGYQ